MPTLILINVKKKIFINRQTEKYKPEQKQSHELKPGIVVLEKNKDIRKQHLVVPEMMLSSDVSYITQFFLIFLGEWLHRPGNTSSSLLAVQ